MIWLVAVVVAAVIGGMLAPRSSPVGRAPAYDDVDTPDDGVAAGDQVELLRRYGTADDAERLIADGRGDDLAGLGYHGEN